MGALDHSRVTVAARLDQFELQVLTRDRTLISLEFFTNSHDDVRHPCFEPPPGDAAATAADGGVASDRPPRDEVG